MDGDPHPLVQPRAVTALALAGLCTAGWGLIASQMIGLGLALSLAGAAMTVWLYSGDLRAAWATGFGHPTTLPKELWIAVAIISAGIVIPLWLALQTPSSPAANATWQSFALPIAFVLAACFGYLFGQRERFRDAPGGSTAQRLYVGQIHASLDRLAQDYSVELAIRFFNGTSQTLTLGQLTGAIRYGESIDGRGTEGDLLPAPAVLGDRTNISQIAPFTETMIVLDQRVPREIAERMQTLIADGHSVSFDMRPLQIAFHAIGRPTSSNMLPLYGISFRRTSRAEVNRIAYAQMQQMTVTDRLG